MRVSDRWHSSWDCWRWSVFSSHAAEAAKELPKAPRFRRGISPTCFPGMRRTRPSTTRPSTHMKSSIITRSTSAKTGHFSDDGRSGGPGVCGGRRPFDRRGSSPGSWSRSSTWRFSRAFRRRNQLYVTLRAVGDRRAEIGFHGCRHLDPVVMREGETTMKKSSHRAPCAGNLPGRIRDRLRRNPHDQLVPRHHLHGRHHDQRGATSTYSVYWSTSSSCHVAGHDRDRLTGTSTTFDPPPSG